MADYAYNPFDHLAPHDGPYPTVAMPHPFNRQPVFSTMGRGPRGEQGERGFPGEASRKDFETVAKMAAETSLKSGDICRTLGFHAAGDGGAAWYQVTDDATANDKDIIALENGLYAVLQIIEAYVTPEMFGAYGDGVHDDSSVIQYCINNNVNIYLLDSVYNCSDSIVIPSGKRSIKGVENRLSVLYFPNTDGIVCETESKGSIYLTLENITVRGNSVQNTVGVSYKNMVLCNLMTNCVVERFSTNVKMERCENCKLDNPCISGALEYGLYLYLCYIVFIRGGGILNASGTNYYERSCHQTTLIGTDVSAYGGMEIDYSMHLYFAKNGNYSPYYENSDDIDDFVGGIYIDEGSEKAFFHNMEITNYKDKPTFIVNSGYVKFENITFNRGSSVVNSIGFDIKGGCYGITIQDCLFYWLTTYIKAADNVRIALINCNSSQSNDDAIDISWNSANTSILVDNCSPQFSKAFNNANSNYSGNIFMRSISGQKVQGDSTNMALVDPNAGRGMLYYNVVDKKIYMHNGNTFVEIANAQ